MPALQLGWPVHKKQRRCQAALEDKRPAGQQADKASCVLHSDLPESAAVGGSWGLRLGRHGGLPELPADALVLKRVVNTQTVDAPGRAGQQRRAARLVVIPAQQLPVCRFRCGTSAPEPLPF